MTADLPGPADTVWSAVRQAVGAGAVGQRVEVRGLTGQVERVGVPPEPAELLLRLTGPVPGLLGFWVYGKGEGVTAAAVEARLFPDDPAGFVEREGPAWKAWLESVAVPTG